MAQNGDHEIAYIADHDARIEQIRLLPEGRCEVVFSHLEVSRPTDLEADEVEAYEVRAYRAVLLLTELSSFACSGRWDARSMLSDGEVFDSAGARIGWRHLLTEQAIRRVELTFTLDDRIEITAGRAILRLEGEGTFFERWSGPL